MNHTATLPPEASAALTAAILTETEIESIAVNVSDSERIQVAYEVAHVFATQVLDTEYRANLVAKLDRSNVHGSQVLGVSGKDRVEKMLAEVINWREISSNLEDGLITVLEGELPAEYTAFAAYASIGEIAETFGHQGVGSISVRIGYQRTGEVYLCTLAKMPTRIITVQLKKDASGAEYVHQWFAGREKSSYVYTDDRSILVRCGVILQPVDQQVQNRGKIFNKNPRKPQN